MEEPLCVDGDKGWFYCIDFTGLLTLIVSIVVLLIVMFVTKLDPLMVPENDSLSDFPAPEKETLPASIAAMMVAIPQLVFVLGTFFLQRCFPRFLRRFHVFSAIWAGITSTLMVYIVTEYLKSFVGRARPDIYRRCGHDYGECRGNISDKADDQFKSWPSGHASTSLGCTLWVTLFLQKVIKVKQMWVPVLITLFLMLGFYIGATRIKDFRHHPDDVLAGFFFGFVITYIIWRRTYKRIFVKASTSELAAPEP
jgi:phosphatidate phosphatase